MAAYKNLGDELECPICKDHFQVPKIMGTCLHVACLGCLEKLVADEETDFFPCPVCRKKCKIPTQSVAALKDDFRLGSIVEKYKKLGKDVIHCSACPNPASHLCKKCKIYMCIFCSEKHSQDSLTAAHELVGICNKHGQKLAMYCRKCGTAICSVCRIVEHPSGSQEHDVVPHQEVADEEVTAVAAAVEKSEKTQGQKEIALTHIKRIQDSVVATIDSDLSLLGKQSESVFEEVYKTLGDLHADKSRIQEEIKALTKRMKAVDEEIVATDNKITSDLQKNNENSGYLNMYRDSCLERFKEAVKQTVVETDEIKVKVDLACKETSSKRILDDQTVQSLQKVKEELVQAITTAEKIDRVAPFVDATDKLPRFVPASGQLVIGHIRRRVFTKLKKSVDILFPAGRGLVYDVKHLPNGHLACLYRSNMDVDSTGADAIRLHDSEFPTESTILRNTDIHPAAAMAVTTKGEPMVLRTVEPVVRIFRNGGISLSNIRLGGDGHLHPCSVECDEEDNVFIAVCSLGGSNASIFVFKNRGITEGNVENFALELPGMSYCRLTRTLYIANGNTLQRCHWDGTTLKTMPSIVLGVDRFTCTDVCIGDGGEVLVAGTYTLPAINIFGVFADDTDDPNEYTISMVYQVVEAEETESQIEGQKPVRQKEHATGSTDEEDTSVKNIDSSQDEDKRTKFNLIELSFDDNVKRWTKGSTCRISIFGNTLALGYDDKLELFHPLP